MTNTFLHQRFPALGQFRITSPATSDYNCIAWAAADTGRWWWPNPFSYWPKEAPNQVTLSAFQAAFRSQGYEVCEDSSVEEGYEKVALYTLDGEPKHAARQLPNGRWTSKLGPWKDIEHETPESLEGPEYGMLAVIMRRLKIITTSQ